MPTYRHPRAAADAPGHPPHRVHVSRADKREVDDAGRFEAPPGVARRIAEDHGTTLDAMRVEAESGASGGASDDTASGSGGDEDDEDAGSTAEQIGAGECPWCSDYTGEHVGQHASSAHPDEWDAYQSEA